jgi:hypothetical protein
LYDDVIFVDWSNNPTGTVQSELTARSYEVDIVVTAVEDLLRHKIQLENVLNIESRMTGLKVLQSKFALRKLMESKSIPAFPEYIGDTLSNIADRAFDAFPCFLKPAEASGGARHVIRVQSRTELGGKVDELSSSGISGNTQFVLEKEFRGYEFSVDGIVENHIFRPLFCAEYIFRQRHHAIDVIHPPMNVSDEQISRFNQIVQSVVDGARLDSMWLHIEGMCNDEDLMIVEINPRMGGGTYSQAIELATGLDPVEVFLELQISGSFINGDSRFEIATDSSFLAMVHFCSDFPGRLRRYSSSDLKNRVEGIESIHVLDGYVSEAKYQRHDFAEVLVSADSSEVLMERIESIRELFAYSFESINA